MSDLVTLAAVRVLTRRAVALRTRAAALVTTVQDSAGRPVQIVSPEARVMLATAVFLDDCAIDLTGAGQ